MLEKLKLILVATSLLVAFTGVQAQEENEKKKKKTPLSQRLWGGYDSNAIEKNLVIKDAFVTEGEKLLSGVKVAVKINSATVDSMLTDKNGGFKTDLRFDYKYLLEFSKSGYVTKLVEIDLSNIPVEFKNEGYDLGRFQMGMVRQTAGMDLAEYKIPVARYYFDDRNRMVVLDRVYLKNRKQQIEEQKKRNEKIVEKVASENDEIQEEYNILIRDADIEFEAKDYELAKSYYQDALKLKPLAEYPRDQLKIIDVKLSGNQAAKEQYQALITQADEAYELKDYEEAKELYQASIKINTTDAYPRERIKKIDSILATLATNNEKPKEKKNLTLKNVEISSDRAAFCSELAKKYPQGLTEEKYMEGSKSITRRIIVEGDVGVEYKHVVHNWGGNYFYKNGKPTTRFIWQKEALQN